MAQPSKPWSAQVREKLDRAAEDLGLKQKEEEPDPNKLTVIKPEVAFSPAVQDAVETLRDAQWWKEKCFTKKSWQKRAFGFMHNLARLAAWAVGAYFLWTFEGSSMLVGLAKLSMIVLSCLVLMVPVIIRIEGETNFKVRKVRSEDRTFVANLFSYFLDTFVFPLSWLINADLVAVRKKELKKRYIDKLDDNRTERILNMADDVAQWNAIASSVNQSVTEAEMVLGDAFEAHALVAELREDEALLLRRVAYVNKLLEDAPLGTQTQNFEDIGVLIGHSADQMHQAQERAAEVRDNIKRAQARREVERLASY